MSEKCTWTKLNDGGGWLFLSPLYETSCNEKFYIGTDFKFCPGCSKLLSLDDENYNNEKKKKDEEKASRKEELPEQPPSEGVGYQKFATREGRHRGGATKFRSGFE